MSKIERISKDNPELKVNLVSLIGRFDPSQTGKYIPFLIKQLKRNISGFKYNAVLNDLFPKNSTDIDQVLMYYLYQNLGHDNLYSLWELDKHINDNRVEEKDIQKYNSWDDVINNQRIGELKLKEKSLVKQIDKLYDDQEWVVLKPLSFESSLAYGSGTKWCTASKNNSSYFYEYSHNGVLIYVLNKKNGYKVAMYINLNLSNSSSKKINEISFWTANDHKVESLELNLPDNIMSVLRGIINDQTKLKPNKYFFSEEELNKINKPNKKSMLMGGAIINRGEIDIIENLGIEEAHEMVDLGEVEQLEGYEEELYIDETPEIDDSAEGFILEDYDHEKYPTKHIISDPDPVGIVNPFSYDNEIGDRPYDQEFAPTPLNRDYNGDVAMVAMN